MYRYTTLTVTQGTSSQYLEISSLTTPFKTTTTVLNKTKQKHNTTKTTTTMPAVPHTDQTQNRNYTHKNTDTCRMYRCYHIRLKADSQEHQGACYKMHSIITHQLWVPDLEKFSQTVHSPKLSILPDCPTNNTQQKQIWPKRE